MYFENQIRKSLLKFIIAFKVHIVQEKDVKRDRREEGGTGRQKHTDIEAALRGLLEFEEAKNGK